MWGLSSTVIIIYAKKKIAYILDGINLAKENITLFLPVVTWRGRRTPEGKEKGEQAVREEAEEEEWVARVVRREAQKDQEQGWDPLARALKQVVVVVVVVGGRGGERFRKM